VDNTTINFKILQLKKVNYQVRDPKAGSYQHVNDPLSSIQRGKLTPCKSNSFFPKKYFVSRNFIPAFHY